MRNIRYYRYYNYHFQYLLLILKKSFIFFILL